MAQPQLPILKGKNYEIWSKKMQSILEHADIWYVVEADSIADEKKKKEADLITDDKKKKEADEKKKKADEKMKKDDKTARFFILNGLDDSLDDTVLCNISAAESSKEAWSILKGKYTNESRINNNVALSVAISAGFVLRLLFGDVPSDSGMQSFVLIEVFAMVLLIYVIYNVAGLKITNAQFRAMAIGAVLGMIVAISGPLLGASMNPARLASSSISIYMILGAVLGAIYYDVITPPSVPLTPTTHP